MPTVAPIRIRVVPLLADAVVPVITGVAGTLVGVVGMWVAVSTMWERRQPIVIAHEGQHLQHDEDTGGWVAVAYLTNESGPAAFNVRFGLEYEGVRFPFKRSRLAPPEGSYERVVKAEGRVPDEAALADPPHVGRPALVEFGGEASFETEETYSYWCRYENARGETWETHNPRARSAKLEIHRVRRVRRLEAREEEQRARLRSSEWEASVLQSFDDRHARSDEDHLEDPVSRGSTYVSAGSPSTERLLSGLRKGRKYG